MAGENATRGVGAGIHVNSSSDSNQTSWINSFYLIFSTTVQEGKLEKKDDLNNKNIPSRLKDAEKQCSSSGGFNSRADMMINNISITMRSIIDEIVYQSCTCFQMEYVIMGYLKVQQISVDNANPAARPEESKQMMISENNNPQVAVRLKGSLAMGSAAEAVEESSKEAS